MNFRSFKNQNLRNQIIILIIFLIVLIIIIYLLFQSNIFEFGDDYVEIEKLAKIDPLKADYYTHYLDNSPENIHLKYG